MTIARTCARTVLLVNAHEVITLEAGARVVGLVSRELGREVLDKSVQDVEASEQVRVVRVTDVITADNAREQEVDATQVVTSGVDDIATNRKLALLPLYQLLQSRDRQQTRSPKS